MDFTLSAYKLFLKELIDKKYNFQTFYKFLKEPLDKSIILRHDVDKLPQNSLKFAQIQHELGIKASYYFRIVPESFNENIIKQIADLGHEIGYHYEDMDLVWKAKDNRPWTMDNSGNTIDHRPWSKGRRIPYIDKNSLKIKDNQLSSIVHRPSSLHQAAIKSFEKNLSKLREIAPINTICMHGSPRSPFDNKDLWKYYNYRDYGIIGEPYFDIDFTKVAYYTDTGRMWDGDKYSVRDRVDKEKMTIDDGPWEGQPTSPKSKPNSRTHELTNSLSSFPSFHSTQNIITALQNNTSPPQAMLTFHPQRWTNDPALWTKELIMQSVKNIVKKYFFVKTK